MTRPRLICTITVSDRQARITAVPFSGRHTVTYYFGGKPSPVDPPENFDTKQEAMRAARAFAWYGLEPIQARLHTFAKAHGRSWKRDLAALWSSGKDAGDPQLRHARNVLGPAWLKTVSTADLGEP